MPAPQESMRRYFFLTSFLVLFIGCNRRNEEPVNIVSPYYNNIKELHKRIGICDSNFPENRSPYYLDVFMIRDLPTSQAGYIFRINSYDNNDWEYLFYTKQGSDWRFAGYIDKISQFYTEPLQRYKSTGHYNWFVIKYVSCEGTGIYEESEEWYDLTKIPIKPVLKYVTEMNSTFYDDNALVKYTILSNDLNIDNAVPVLTLKVKIAIYKTTESENEKEAKPFREYFGNICYKFISKNNMFQREDSQSDSKTLSFLRDGILPWKDLKVP